MMYPKMRNAYLLRYSWADQWYDAVSIFEFSVSLVIKINLKNTRYLGLTMLETKKNFKKLGLTMLVAENTFLGFFFFFF